MAYRRDDFIEYYRQKYVQLPLEKGDSCFFNPAVFHAAGSNVTENVHRMGDSPTRNCQPQ